MGSSAPRHWIILSYFANIDGKAASQHLDDRLPHLRALGVEPLLVSSVCGRRRTDLAHFTVPSVAPSGVRFELRYLRRRNRFLKFALLPLYLAVLPFYLLEKVIINIDSQWSWFPSGFLRGLRLCKTFRPELVYSTGGPVSAHVGAALLSRFAKIPWIAELQDPLVYDSFPRSGTALKINARIERLILAKASAVVFLTEGAMGKALSGSGISPSRVRIIRPGAAPPDLPPVSWTKGDFCRFAHFGSLGGSRNLRVFLEALDTIFTADPDLAKIVRFDLYGTMDKLSQKLISDFKYPGVVTDFGKVPRRDAVLAMQKSDVLVMIHNLDDFATYTIPAKIYDYFQVNRPVLGLVYRNRGLREMLVKYGHFAAEADSVAETAGCVSEIIKRWGSGDLTGPGWSESPFTVRAAVQSLVALSEEILAKG
ncbi:MAG: glycosyltransferase [Syntrophobacteraceae bacterium]